jgi:predicted aspartyl protease
MENATMGKVLVPAKIENLDDLFRVKTGDRAEADVRRIDVSDALVDTGAFGLLMPMRMIEHLGLDPVRTRMSRTISGEIPITTYRAVRLTIQGRDCVIDVSGIADHLPVIIGQIPLEAMDWVVDMRGQRLIGNPDHGGEDMVDVF